MESLGLDIKLLFAQIVNFAILFFVLNRLLYKPLMKALDDRNKKIESSIANSQLIEERLAKIEAKEAEVVAKAQEKGRKEKAEIVAMALREKDKIIEEAKNAAKREVEKGIESIKSAESESVKSLTDDFMDRLVDKLQKKIIADTKKDNYPILKKIIK